ncbi:FAD-binding oxidoreductase [Microbacterium sp. GXF0217]
MSTPTSSTAWPTPGADVAAAAVSPGDDTYPWVRSTYMRVGSPELVIRPVDDAQVAAGLRYAAEVRRETGKRVPFSIRSGGHGISGSGTNDGGIVLDLSRMRAMDLEADGGILRVQAGATWGEVANLLSPHDLTITSGNFGDTGVGGLATAGGIGYFARSQGLTIDRVVRAKVATPDGSIRWVDEHNEPEIFWAVRGGAAHAGVAIEFDVLAEPIHSAAGDATIIHQNIQYLVTDLARFTNAWGEWIDGAPREAESFLMIQRDRQGSAVVHARNVWANDDVGAARPTLSAALGLDRVLGQDAQAVPYAAIVPSPGSPHIGQQTIRMRDVLVDSADEKVGAALAATLEDGITLVAEVRALGGAVSDAASESTAWAARSQRALAGIWTQPATIERVDAAFAPLQDVGTGAYGAYSSDIRSDTADLVWPGATGERLRRISEDVDPEHLFDGGLVLRRAEGSADARAARTRR